jgi:Tfp pilus assembly protein PilX
VDHDRGVALILALLVLSFLSILGGALLTTSTIDIWISDNYKTSTQSLYVAEAGIDHAREVLRTSGRTPTDLLNMFAGRPLLSQQLIDSSGRSGGYYSVWLRNDNGDGMASLTDSNEILTLVSLGEVGSSRKTIEVTVQKGKFPETDADPRLKTVGGLEKLVAGIARNATDIYAAPKTVGDIGNPSNYRVVVVNGDADLGPGTGYGILLVTGDVTVAGNFTWNGLVLIIGQGVLHPANGVYGTINGGLFIARTRAPDGTLLDAPADVVFNINNTAEMKAANQLFPFNPVAIKER